MIGDLPEAESKPPSNMLFICKLNQVTTEEVLVQEPHTASASPLPVLPRALFLLKSGFKAYKDVYGIYVCPGEPPSSQPAYPDYFLAFLPC